MVEKTVNYLLKISDHLDKHVPSDVNLSRFLREKCAQSIDRSNSCVRLPDTFSTHSLCPSCFTPWTQGFCKLKFLHSDSKKKKKQSMLKLLAKEPNTLNRFQAALVARAKSGPHSSMRITCLKCTKVTKIRLGKIFAEDQSVQIKRFENVSPVATEIVTLPKKKKKKKKDRFCGLNQHAVSSIKKVNDRLSDPTKNHELSTDYIKPNKHKSNDIQNIKIKSNGHNGQSSLNLSNSNISTSNSILVVDNLPPISKNLYGVHLNSHKELNQSNNSVNTSNGTLGRHSSVELDLPLAKVDVNTENRSISPSSSSTVSYNNNKRKETVRDKSINNYLESCNTSNVGGNKKLKIDCDVSSVSFQNGSELQIKIKDSKVKKPTVSSITVACSTSNEVIKKTDAKSNLSSQPKLNSIKQNNKPSNNESQINPKSLTDSTSTFQRDSKNKNLNNNNSSNNNKLNKISLSNKLQLSQNDTRKKKKSKKTKMKGSKSSQKEYKVFERSNCTNSLCVNDLLSLT